MQSDWISGVALDQGWGDFGLILTLVAILIEAQREEVRKFTSQNTCYCVAISCFGARITTAFANLGF